MQKWGKKYSKTCAQDSCKPLENQCALHLHAALLRIIHMVYKLFCFQLHDWNEPSKYFYESIKCVVYGFMSVGYTSKYSLIAFNYKLQLIEPYFIHKLMFRACKTRTSTFCSATEIWLVSDSRLIDVIHIYLLSSLKFGNCFSTRVVPPVSCQRKWFWRSILCMKLIV